MEFSNTGDWGANLRSRKHCTEIVLDDHGRNVGLLWIRRRLHGHCADCWNRVYMGIEDAPVKEIMKDMMEMSRGVQHPMRYAFAGVRSLMGGGC